MNKESAKGKTIIKYLLPDGRIEDVVGPEVDCESAGEALVVPAKLVIDASTGRLMDVQDFK